MQAFQHPCTHPKTQPLPHHLNKCHTQHPPTLQAKKLDEMLAARGKKIDSVLNFDVPDEMLVGPRLGARALRAA